MAKHVSTAKSPHNEAVKSLVDINPEAAATTLLLALDFWALDRVLRHASDRHTFIASQLRAQLAREQEARAPAAVSEEVILDDLTMPPGDIIDDRPMRETNFEPEYELAQSVE